MCRYKILYITIFLIILILTKVCSFTDHLKNITLENSVNSAINKSELLDSESRHRFLFEVNKVIQLHRPKGKSRHVHSPGRDKHPSGSRNRANYKSHSSKTKFKEQSVFPPPRDFENHRPFESEYENFYQFHAHNHKRRPHFLENEGRGHVEFKSEHFHPYSTIYKNKGHSSAVKIENNFPPYDTVEGEMDFPPIHHEKKKRQNQSRKNKSYHKSRNKSPRYPKHEAAPENNHKTPLFPPFVDPLPHHPLSENSFKLDLQQFNPDDEKKVAFLPNEFFNEFDSGHKTVDKFKSDIDKYIHRFQDGHENHKSKYNEEHDYKHYDEHGPPEYEGHDDGEENGPGPEYDEEEHEPKYDDDHHSKYPKENPRMPGRGNLKTHKPKGKEIEEKIRFKSREPVDWHMYRSPNEKDEPEAHRVPIEIDEQEIYRKSKKKGRESYREPKEDDREIYRRLKEKEERETYRKPKENEERENYRRPKLKEEREIYRSPKENEEPEIFRGLREEEERKKYRSSIPKELEMIRPKVPKDWDINRLRAPPNLREIIRDRERAPTGRDRFIERAPRERFSKRYFNLFTTSFRQDPNQKRSHGMLLTRHKKALTDISNMCAKDSLFAGYNPQHKSAMNALVQMYNDHKDVESMYEMSTFLKDQVHPQMWYASLMRAQLAHAPHLLAMESRPNPIYLFPSRFFPVDVLQENGNKHSSELDCVPLDERFGEDNGIENRLWYFREDVQLNAHHWIWHLLFPFNSTMAIERRGEFFYFFHHELVARYITERISNGLPIPVSLNLQLDSVVEEGYNPHLVDGISTRAFAPRPPHLIFPGALNETGFEALYNITVLRDRVIDILFTGTVFRGSKQIPIHTVDNINILGELSEASLQSINPEFYGSIGYHNLGHMFLGTLIGNYPPGTIGVIGDQATAMRDVIFYRWHKLVDTLFQTYKVTHLPPYSLHSGDFPLVFKGIKIRDLDVMSNSGGTLNHLRTYWESREFNLEGGLDFNSQNGTSPPNVKVCAKHLDHEEFVYHFRIECNRAKEVRARIRLFLAPRYKTSKRHEKSRFTISEQRLLFFSLDSFVTVLKPGSNILSRKSIDSALTAPWPQSIQQLREDIESGSGKKSKCECGYPHHLLLPKGNEEGMVFDLFAMVTDATKETIHDQKPNINECTPSHIHCGIAGKPYPDVYPMGYPFDRKPFTEGDTSGKVGYFTPDKKKRHAVDEKTLKKRREEIYDTLEEDLYKNDEIGDIYEDRRKQKSKYKTLEQKERFRKDFDHSDLSIEPEVHDEHLRLFNSILENENHSQLENEDPNDDDETEEYPPRNLHKYFQHSSKENKMREDEDERDDKEFHNPKTKSSHHYDHHGHGWSMLEEFVSRVPNMATTQIVISHRDEFGL